MWESVCGECGGCRKVCWGVGEVWLGELRSEGWGRRVGFGGAGIGGVGVGGVGVTMVVGSWGQGG